MYYWFDLVLYLVEGVLLCVIGMVECCGFVLCVISGVLVVVDDGCWYLQLVVDGQCLVEMLCWQIEKIYDCVFVQVIVVEGVFV